MSDHYVEVWVESRSLAGVLEATCDDLAVSLYPSGGFSSLTLTFEAARHINEVFQYTGKQEAHILYVGDYDPAGVHIDRDIEAKLRRHLKPNIQLDFLRLGINPEQIHEYDLPTKPRKEGERRRVDIEMTVEAEAMPAGILRELLRESVEQYLPEGALKAAKVAEESEREGLYLLAKGLRSAALSGPPVNFDESDEDEEL